MIALPFFRREPPALTGGRIFLRMPGARDYREWAALRAESRGFLEPWEPRWTSDELDVSAWRQRLARYREDFDQGSGAAFFIFEMQSRRLMGGITVGNIRYGVAQTGQIGYWIGQRYAGNGFMYDALRLVCQHAFQTLRLHRLEAACIQAIRGRSACLKKPDSGAKDCFARISRSTAPGRTTTSTP